MSWIEWKRRIVAVAFVSAETSIGDALAAAVHCRGVPQFREIPIVVAKVCNRIQDFAAGYGTFVVDHGSGGTRPALKLRPTFKRRLRDQIVHVDIDCRFEETGIAAVIVLDGCVSRVFADYV